ncbi:MAG: acetolactate decarboxylase [Campylobacterota bacterium]|nr:acetolactate decarboxylase [Campylobacterota bacterium]
MDKSISTSKNRNMLYQVGTIRSLLGGVYEGDVSFDELAHHGDFGIGTFDAVNGEMIAIDGYFYRIDADGRAHKVSPDMKTPFALVTHFEHKYSYSLDRCSSLAVLENQILSLLKSRNIIYALHLKGDFSSIDVRSEHPQPQGHRPLCETISQVQTSFDFKDIFGAIVGFWFPEYMGAINVPGFHFHFLDRSRQVGGHMFDLSLECGTLEVMPIYDFGMHLIHTPLFEYINLDSENDAAIKKVEKR